TCTPAANYNGGDSFKFTVTDRGDPDNCSAAPCSAAHTTLRRPHTIIKSPFNSDARATNRSASTNEDTASSPIDLGALVSDVETRSEERRVGKESRSGRGRLSGKGTTRTYTPRANYNGPDSFTYTVTERGEHDNRRSPASSR